MNDLTLSITENNMNELPLIANWLANLEKDMKSDSRCNPKYTNAVGGIRESVQIILDNE